MGHKTADMGASGHDPLNQTMVVEDRREDLLSKSNEAAGNYGTQNRDMNSARQSRSLANRVVRQTFMQTGQEMI